jgi:hypothetical protein
LSANSAIVNEGAQSMWPDSRLTKLLSIDHPIILAPMAGGAKREAGGLRKLVPCSRRRVK